MNKGINFTFLVRLLTVGLVIVALYMILDYSASVTPPVTPTQHTTAIISGELTPVRLTVQAINATQVFTTVGQVITYNYVVTNTGNTALAGPVTISDDKMTGIACPNTNTAGNLDSNLDLNETLTCTGTYAITQADLNAGSITNNATATIGGVISALTTTTLRMAENKVLTIAKSASPTTYSQVGQTITYTYTINNAGPTTLGPAQFIVRDDRIGTPINCGAAATILATNQIVTCTATYIISQNDMTVAQLTNNATASGGGAGSIQPATVTITNTNVVYSPGTPSSLVRGSTIQHKVVEGEWLEQIARCYRADFDAVRNANPQITDPNANLPPGLTLSIPNIGSNGTIYGPPCVVFYTFQDGDTWESIAQKHNADIDFLQQANSGVVLSSGIQLRIPLNSAGSTVPVTPQPGMNLINIPVGTNTVTLSGTVSASGKVLYVLAATQGQTLSLKVIGPANEIALAVYQPTGTVLKAQDTTLIWTGTIPTTGDYIIELVSVLVSPNKSFTIEVSLTASAPPVTISASETSQPFGDLYANLQLEQDKIPMGQFVYHPPKTMMLGETRDFVLLLSPSLSVEALATEALAASGLPTSVAMPGLVVEPDGARAIVHAGTIEITSEMQAVLSATDAEAFVISQEHDAPEQIVDPNFTTKWHWRVTAKKGGPQKLILVVYRQAKVGNKVYWPEYETFRDEITVNVTFGQRLGLIDWKWIIGMIVTALLIPAFWRWVDQRKKQPESISTPKPAKKKAKKQLHADFGESIK